MDKYRKFYNNPQNFIPISQEGDHYLKEFNKRYAGLRMKGMLPIFYKAYDLLTKRKCYSRKTAFGEMSRDGYIWIMKHDTIKVIVEERQSYKYIYIDDGSEFHIRALNYKNNYPQKPELTGITEDKFKEQNFRHDFKQDGCNGFKFGDARDEGYILSCEYNFEGMEEADHVNDRTLIAIDSIEFWDYYLDNPDEII